MTGTEVAGLVSVVIPTRNRRGFLEEAIASVTAQDYESWELIVVDDASTDGTAAFLATLSDPRVRHVRLEEHGERSAARNRGLAEARGELVMFLDDDDRLRPGALSALAPPLLADREAVAAVGARYRFTAESGARIPHPQVPMRLRVEEDVLCLWLGASAQNLFRTAVVRSVGGYDAALRVSEDRDLWIKVAARGPVLARPEIVMDGRIHPGQTDTTGREDMRALIFSRYIATLPPSRRRRARRIQKSGEDRWSAHQHAKSRRWLPAFFLAVRSVVRHPGVLRSPLLGRVMREVLGNSLPPRLVRLLSRIRRGVTGRPTRAR